MNNRTKSPVPTKSAVIKSVKFAEDDDNQIARTNVKAIIAEATNKFLVKHKVPLRLVTTNDLRRGISLVFTVTGLVAGDTPDRKKISCIQALIHVDDYDSPYPHLTGELGLNDCDYEVSFDPDPSKPAGIHTLRLNIYDTAAGAAAAMLNVFTCRNYATPVVFGAVVCMICLGFFYFC